MGVVRPTLADPQIAALTFRAHLDALWATGRPEKFGWLRTTLSPMETVVTLPALRADGKRDLYYVKLGAEYYDVAPPMVLFVEPGTWTVAIEGTQWFPRISPPPWFGLHNAYGYPDGTQRQLVCFTFTAQYYQVDHSPPDTTIWKQGRHTVAATLNRLAEVLTQPYYHGPSGQGPLG